MRRGGDLRAFEHAYRAEGPYVAAVLGRLAVPADTVGDAVQDVFVAAYRRWSDFDRSRPVRPWLTGFARRVAFRYRRSAARRLRKGIALTHVQRDREPEPTARLVARDFLQQFLGGLDPGHRRAFVLAEIEGLTAPEVAQALGIGTEAVYGRLRSTRRRLKQALLDDAGRRPDPKAAALVPPWAIVLQRIGAGASPVLPALGGTTLGTVKAFATTVGLGMLALGAVAVAQREPPTRQAPASPTRHAAPASPHTPAPRAAPRTSTASALAPSASPAVRSAPAMPLARVAPATSASTVVDPLAHETALLRAAQRSLTQGDPAAALTSLEEHARTFPEGQLADARRRTRIRALCDLGRQAQARGEAQQMARAHPGDPLALQSVSICATAIQTDQEPEKSP